MVLILDNNNKRAIGLGAALSFVGQANEVLAEERYEPKILDNNQEPIFVLGALQSLTHEALIKSHPAVPFLLIGETLRRYLRYRM